MLGGYVTYEELKIITGFSEPLLNKLILSGMKLNEMEVNGHSMRKLKTELFNLSEVEKWLKVHIY